MTGTQGLVGTFSVEVGERQAWPFITFCDNESTPSREARLYIGADFMVNESAWQPPGEPESAIQLLPLNNRRVVAVEEGDGALSIVFDGGNRLTVSGVASASTVGDVWWVGPWNQAWAVDVVVAQLRDWRDTDEPLVEAIGNALAAFDRLDSQEQARRIVDLVVETLEGHAPRQGSQSDGPRLARQAIERVVWKHGHQGDACARITHEILLALDDAGFAISPPDEIA